MRGREGEFEAADRLLGEPSLSLLGNVRGMIIEDQLDRGMDRIGGVEKLEKFDEFATAVAILDEVVNLAGQQINPGQQADCAIALVFMIAREGRVPIPAAFASLSSCVNPATKSLASARSM